MSSELVTGLHRAGLAAGAELREQPGGGLEVQRPDMVVLDAGPGLPVAEVQVGRARAEDLLGPGD